jgi:hypothetical protein
MSTVVEPEELSVEKTTFPLTLTVKSAIIQNSNVNVFLRDYFFLLLRKYGTRKPSTTPIPSPAMMIAVVLTFGGGVGGGATTNVGDVSVMVGEVVGLTVGTVGDVETVGEVVGEVVGVVGETVGDTVGLVVGEVVGLTVVLVVVVRPGDWHACM